mmetsp:Transcript_32060/g.67005  ORF Transcript_32060/g.67005 Transcript_32060/m.67005 type:complete len:279 (-) Transcript_32060:733-1569(-)
MHAPRGLAVDSAEGCHEEEPDGEDDNGRHDPRCDARRRVEAAAAEEQHVERQVAEEDYEEAREPPRARERAEDWPPNHPPQHVLRPQQLQGLHPPRPVPVRQPLLQDGLDHDIVPRPLHLLLAPHYRAPALGFVSVPDPCCQLRHRPAVQPPRVGAPCEVRRQQRDADGKGEDTVRRPALKRIGLGEGGQQVSVAQRLRHQRRKVGQMVHLARHEPPSVLRYDGAGAEIAPRPAIPEAAFVYSCAGRVAPHWSLGEGEQHRRVEVRQMHPASVLGSSG